MAAKVKAYVPRTFNDAGTGETFAGGREHPFDPGALANYRAAGLIGVAPPKTTAPKRAARPKRAPKPTPARAAAGPLPEPAAPATTEI